jgi:hypothetical protein
MLASLLTGQQDSLPSDWLASKPSVLPAILLSVLLAILLAGQPASRHAGMLAV